MDFIRKKGAYKCFRIDCSKVCNINFHSIESFSKISPCLNGQHSCPVISHQNGGNTKHNFVSVEQRHLKIFTEKSNQNYCRERRFLPGGKS